MPSITPLGLSVLCLKTFHAIAITAMVLQGIFHANVKLNGNFQLCRSLSNAFSNRRNIYHQTRMTPQCFNYIYLFFNLTEYSLAIFLFFSVFMETRRNELICVSPGDGRTSTQPPTHRRPHPRHKTHFSLDP